jgi:hypothetical protein
MSQSEARTTWVVYRMTLNKQVIGGNVVCEQWEWDAIELARPGYHVLLHSGIGTEQEAEKLARGTAGDTVPRGVRKKADGQVTASPPGSPVAPPTAQ